MCTNGRIDRLDLSSPINPNSYARASEQHQFSRNDGTEETMADPKRYPGSREEDAWLSDEQLSQVAPAETEPFQSPVPTRMISNGEYLPYPQTKQQQHVEYRIKELAETAAKKLGVSRRQFLEGTGGLAASFIAINEAFG